MTRPPEAVLAECREIYLPLSWLRDEGIDPDTFVQAPRFEAGIGVAVCRLLDHAEALYRRAGAGVSALPRDCRVAIAAARHIYADIGRVIRSRGYDSVSSRAMTSGGDKLRLALRALPAWLPVADRTPYHPPLSEIRFLVEDVRS